MRASLAFLYVALTLVSGKCFAPDGTACRDLCTKENSGTREYAIQCDPSRNYDLDDSHTTVIADVAKIATTSEHSIEMRGEKKKRKIDVRALGISLAVVAFAIVFLGFLAVMWRLRVMKRRRLAAEKEANEMSGMSAGVHEVNSSQGNGHAP